MKRFVLSTMVAFIVAVTSNICAANSFDNDPNYVFVTTAHGTIYLDLRTVAVQEYSPPYYQIAGTFINTDGTRITNQQHVVIRYNTDARETYRRNNSGVWVKDNVNGDTTSPRVNRSFANALFLAAYGRYFY